VVLPAASMVAMTTLYMISSPQGEGRWVAGNATAFLVDLTTPIAEDAQNASTVGTIWFVR